MGELVGRRCFEGIACEGVEQFLYRLLNQYAAVIHDDTVVDQPFHVLYDVRGKEDGLFFGFGVFAQIFCEESAVAGVESYREIVEYQQIGVLGENETQSHLRSLSARHAGDFLFRRDFQFAHEFIIGFFVPFRIKSRVKSLYLFDIHERVLHMVLDEQGDTLAGHRLHSLYVFSEDTAFARAGFQVTH